MATYVCESHRYFFVLVSQTNEKLCENGNSCGTHNIANVCWSQTWRNGLKYSHEIVQRGNVLWQMDPKGQNGHEVGLVHYSQPHLLTVPAILGNLADNVGLFPKKQFGDRQRLKAQRQLAECRAKELSNGGCDFWPIGNVLDNEIRRCPPERFEDLVWCPAKVRRNI